METPNPKPWVADVDVEAQLWDDLTHEVPRASVPESLRTRTQRAGMTRWCFR